MVDTRDVAIEDAREYRRRDARSLKKEFQSSLTSSLPAVDEEFARRPAGWLSKACDGRTKGWKVTLGAARCEGRTAVERRRANCLDAIWELDGRSEAVETRMFTVAGFARPPSTERTDMLRKGQYLVSAKSIRPEMIALFLMKKMPSGGPAGGAGIM